MQFVSNRPAPEEALMVHRFMPYWDAALKFEDGLKRELQLVNNLAVEYAMWSDRTFCGVEKQYSAREAKQFQSRITSLAQTVPVATYAPTQPRPTRAAPTALPIAQPVHMG